MAYFKTGHFICSCFKEECNKDCPSYKKFTHKKNNADRIRAMTDEELAQYICKTQHREGDVCPPTHNCAVYKSCEKCWLDWLKQEANNGD